MNEYELLAAIYKILGNTSINTFEKIERNISQPTEVISIIREFKNTKNILDSKDNKEYESVERLPNGLRNKSNSKEWSKHSIRNWNNLFSYVKDVKKGKIKNQEIIETFQDVGLATNARSKEGRSKMLLVIKEELNGLEDSKRLNIIDQVLTRLGYSQTKGWMEVIRSDKK